MSQYIDLVPNTIKTANTEMRLRNPSDSPWTAIPPEQVNTPYLIGDTTYVYRMPDPNATTDGGDAADGAVADPTAVDATVTDAPTVDNSGS